MMKKYKSFITDMDIKTSNHGYTADMWFNIRFMSKHESDRKSLTETIDDVNKAIHRAVEEEKIEDSTSYAYLIYAARKLIFELNTDIYAKDWNKLENHLEEFKEFIDDAQSSMEAIDENGD